MQLSARARKALPISIVVGFFMLCLVINPQKYISSVYNGMKLFVTSVAPALFPFFFFTKILTGVGCADYLGKALNRPIGALYHTSGASGYIYVMSILSGYPVGSRLIADLYDNGAVSAKEARKISTFTSTSGPLFIVGTVGTLMFRSPSFGYLMMACHFVGALINGLIYRGKKPSAAETRARSPLQNPDDLLGTSITNSIWSLLIVGGYIAIFSMVIDVLCDIGLVSMLAKPVGALLRLCKLPPEMSEGIVISMIEITRGCSVLAQCGLPLKTVMPFCAALLSFGGMSIAFQSMTFLSHCKVGVGFFALSKLTQAIVTFLITLGVCALVYP